MDAQGLTLEMKPREGKVAPRMWKPQVRVSHLIQGSGPPRIHSAAGGGQGPHWPLFTGASWAGRWEVLVRAGLHSCFSMQGSISIVGTGSLGSCHWIFHRDLSTWLSVAREAPKLESPRELISS